MEIRVRAPGRVNLLGEHVDYNDGQVLPAAVDRHVFLAAHPALGDTITLDAADFGEQVSFRLADLERKQAATGEPLPGWALYPAGVAWALREMGLVVQPLTARYHSDIPIGAGLSSSAAVETAFAILWQHLGGWQMDRLALAKACLRAEVEYIGVNCGLMDQFISLHGVAGHALSLDTRTLEWEAIRLPDIQLVIADSRMTHQLASSSYNERRIECQQALELLQRRLPHIQALRDVSVEQFERWAHILPDILRKRARHVVEECERVGLAIQLLKSGDSHGLGKLMFAGHASLRDLYEVSCPELDLLVDCAAQLPGCLGARLTGAGFGGCTINLVEPAQTESFVQALGEAYFRRTGLEAHIFVAQAVRGTSLES